MEKLLNEGGAILVMSPKFHAELAGIGIEYDFGREKWYYKKNGPVCKNVEQMRSWSIKAGDKYNVTLHHSRKHSRRSRDFSCAYRASETRKLGLEATVLVKVLKTHRCALDTDYHFIVEDFPEEVVAVTYSYDSD